MVFKIEKSTIVLALLSSLWAFIPILSSYSANLGDIGAEFVILFGILCAVVTLIVFIILTLIFKSALSAFGGCVVGWILTSASYSVIYSYFYEVCYIRPLYTGIIYLLLMLLIVFVVGLAIKKLTTSLNFDMKKVLIFLSIIVVLLIVVCIIPIVSYSIQSQAIESEHESAELNFTVDLSLPKPNVYWIHAESMINEYTLEKYFGNETVGLTEKLESRGFYVNQHADLIGGVTTYALPALMCPNYYNKYEQYYLKERENSGHSLETIRVISHNTYRENNELLSSFESSGYNSIGIFAKSLTFYDVSTFNNTHLVTDEFTSYLFSNRSINLVIDLENEFEFIKYTVYPLYYALSLLNVDDVLIKSSSSQTIPDNCISENDFRSIVNGSDWISQYSGLMNSIKWSLDNNESPKLLCIYPIAAHSDFIYDEFGNLETNKFEYRILKYYGQYILSEKVVLWITDEILKNDPNAVIVIQGDHGPHAAQEFQDKFDYDDIKEEVIRAYGIDADTIELKNHVLSAVYIPEQYRTEGYEEILYNPLNIARYLVNNFVGQNYEYK